MDKRIILNFRYPNRRLSKAEWASEHIFIIPAEQYSNMMAIEDIKSALKWLSDNLNATMLGSADTLPLMDLSTEMDRIVISKVSRNHNG